MPTQRVVNWGREKDNITDFSAGFQVLVCIAGACPTLTNMLVVVVGGVPIAMPTVLSVTLALGAAKLAKEGAIVARMSAVEEMAGMDILCSDKTGPPPPPPGFSYPKILACLFRISLFRRKGRSQRILLPLCTATSLHPSRPPIPLCHRSKELPPAPHTAAIRAGCLHSPPGLRQATWSYIHNRCIVW